MTEKDWKTYCSKVGPHISKHVQNTRNLVAESFLENAFAYFSYITEDLEKKINKNKEVWPHLHALLVELQDILRGALVSQTNLILASSAFNLRTAFEISCNLKFIYTHTTPLTMAERLSSFFRYEQIVGAMQSSYLTPEPEDTERAFAQKHPYWSKNGLLKMNTAWNGEDLSLKQIAIKLKREPQYFTCYSLQSKFAHGSPIVKNLYNGKHGINCITDPIHSTKINSFTGVVILEALGEYCDFFGIPLSEEEYGELVNQYVSVCGSIGITPVK